MKGFALIWMLSWLLQSPLGRLIIAILILWYLDNRYLGIVAALWAPVVRHRRIAGLRHAVEVNPSDVGAMAELGEHYVRAGKPRLAAEYLEQAAARGEDSPRALYLLGAALVRLGRYGEGRAKLQEALAQHPEVAYGEPYLFLLEEAFANRSADSDHIDQLVAEIGRFDSVEILTRAGRLCQAAGRYDLARRLYGEAIHNYGFVPKKMRRRERRWIVRARLGLLRARSR